MSIDKMDEIDEDIMGMCLKDDFLSKAVTIWEGDCKCALDVSTIDGITKAIFSLEGVECLQLTMSNSESVRLIFWVEKLKKRLK